MAKCATYLVGAIGLFVISGPVAARPRAIDNAELKYSIAIPSECRLQEGPGTLEAVCSPDFDEAKSAELPAATSLLLEVDAEHVPADAKVYGEAEFKGELPEAVCGESDSIKVKLANVSRVMEGATQTFTASVTCPAIKFLGLAERSAEVRYVIASGFRYRLMARALSSDAAAVSTVIDSFMKSFKITEEKKS